MHLGAASKILHRLSRETNFARRMADSHGSADGAPPPSDSSVLPYTAGLHGVKLSKDKYLIGWLWISMVSIAVFILACRILQLCNSHLRRIFSLTASTGQQSYWSFDQTSFWPKFKRSVLYAPLGKKRHNREIKFSEAVNVGTLPSRFHAFLLFLLLGSNIAYCCILDYRESKAAILAEVRGRTGVLATVNMIPLFLFAGRNNPAISLLKVSFDTYNLLHRWIGRIVVVEAFAHTIAWGANSVEAKGMGGTWHSIGGDPFLQYGLAGTVAMAVILIQSPSVLRHAFYETFLHLHQALAFTAILGVYIHLEVAKLPAVPYIRVVVGLWAAERLIRLIRLAYLNISRRHGCTNVVVEALRGEACRVTFNLPRHVTVRPGSHVYAYLPTVSLWMSHPFSVAWTNVDSEPPTGSQLLPPTTPTSPSSLEKQVAKVFPPLHEPKAPTSVSLVMAARTGMTRKIYNKARASEGGILRMPGYVEGPYAGDDSLKSYGTVVLFAGGAGITHHLVQIRHLIAASQAGTVATRKILFVWSVRSVEMLSWVRPWMDEILQMEGRRDILKILLFVTRPKSPRDLVSPSATVKLFPGRCRPGVILDEEMLTRVGATAVSVCGPGAFADEVRAAVRDRTHWGSLDFIEEAFTW
jgi:Ferric reductase like transmembrane component/Ferric reductase NAD binding domain/FAD-binding domain